MALHFHSLTVSNIKKETDDCVVVSFDIPPHLKNTFTFIQGQNVVLKTTINEEEIRRSYSICTSPYDGELSVAIKKVENGIFSNYANETLQIGDVLEVMPPSGKFYVALDADHKKKYVAFACGSGITPIISILKTTLIEEPNSQFILIYSNRTKKSILFFEELENLKNKYVSRLQIIHLLSRQKTESPINQGRINNDKLEQLIKLVNYNNTDAFFICGPQEMIFTTKDFLTNKNIATNKIHFELFGTHKIATPSNIEEVKSNAPQSAITIKLDGRTVEFPLAYKSQNILDAALQHGADLPFACKGGVCCTCRAKLIQGTVTMDVNYALEPEEVAAGYILTCQSHPTSDMVVIDFDQK